MIEVTNDMVRAYAAATGISWAHTHINHRLGLAAVLGVFVRDHTVRPRRRPDSEVPTLRTGGVVSAGTPIRFDGGCVVPGFALPGGESMSERLRQVQADLTRVEQERDELNATVDRMAADHIRLLKRNTLAEAELASARQEIEQLRAAQQWIVARDGGRHCERCEAEIRRGEAYETLAGPALHIRCPDQPERSTT